MCFIKYLERHSENRQDKSDCRTIIMIMKALFVNDYRRFISGQYIKLILKTVGRILRRSKCVSGLSVRNSSLCICHVFKCSKYKIFLFKYSESENNIFKYINVRISHFFNCLKDGYMYIIFQLIELNRSVFIKSPMFDNYWCLLYNRKHILRKHISLPWLLLRW